MKKTVKGIVLCLISFFCILTVSIEAKAAGENLSNPISISLGKTFNGKLTTSMTYDGENRYYKFVVPQNSIVGFKCETESSSQNITFRILDSNGNTIPFDSNYYSSNDDNNWGFQSLKNYISLSKGTYYLAVDSYCHKEVNYSGKVFIYKKSSDKVKIAGLNCRYRNKALPISIGNKIIGFPEGSLSWWDDTIFYKFKVTSKRTVFFKFATDVNDESQDLYFEISDASGDKIEDVHISTDDGYNKETLKLRLKKGTYYIKADSELGLFYDSRPIYSVKTAYKPYSTKITGISSKSKKSMTVKWKKKNPSTGYQIQYSRNSNFKNAKSVKANGSSSSKKITGLARGKKYYVRVRRYNKSFGNTYYSDWSSKKSVRIK